MPTTTTAKKTRAKQSFSAEERAAMKERLAELNGDGDGERAVLAKIAAMAPSDRQLGEKLHAIIMSSAPMLVPRLWYGMPAYAKDGNVLCHFVDARKFKARYATLAFSDKARLDDGEMWPTGFAIRSLGPAEEKRIVALVNQAIGA